MVSFMAMLLLYMNMFTDKPLPLEEPPLRIQPNDLSKGIVEAKSAEAEPDILPSSATFIVKTVSSMDIAFLYICLQWGKVSKTRTKFSLSRHHLHQPFCLLLLHPQPGRRLHSWRTWSQS